MCNTLCTSSKYEYLCISVAFSRYLNTSLCSLTTRSAATARRGSALLSSQKALHTVRVSFVHRRGRCSAAAEFSEQKWTRSAAARRGSLATEQRRRAELKQCSSCCCCKRTVFAEPSHCKIRALFTDSERRGQRLGGRRGRGFSASAIRISQIAAESTRFGPATPHAGHRHRRRIRRRGAASRTAQHLEMAADLNNRQVTGRMQPVKTRTRRTSRRSLSRCRLVRRGHRCSSSSLVLL